MRLISDYLGSSFLINLPERVDRLEATRAELDRVGLGVGMEAAPGNVVLYPARRYTEAAGFDNAGVRGCFDSHYQCLKQALAARSRGVLVLEDDVTFTTALPQLAPSLVDYMSTHDWDLLYFGHELTGEIQRANSETAPTDLEYLKWHGNFHCAHFYAINGRTLPRLIAFLDGLLTRPTGSADGGPMPIDGAYNFFREKNPDIVTLLLSPKLGWQRPSRSDLTPRWFDRVPIARSVLSNLRDLKNIAQRRRA